MTRQRVAGDVTLSVASELAADPFAQVSDALVAGDPGCLFPGFRPDFIEQVVSRIGVTS